MRVELGIAAGSMALAAMGGAAAGLSRDLFSGTTGGPGTMYLFAPALVAVGGIGVLGAASNAGEAARMLTGGSGVGRIAGGAVGLLLGAGAAYAGWKGYEALTR